jgi:hypothetical protein
VILKLVEADLLFTRVKAKADARITFSQFKVGVE